MPPGILALHLWLWPQGRLTDDNGLGTNQVVSPAWRSSGHWEYKGDLENTGDFIKTHVGAQAFDLNVKGYLENNDSSQQEEGEMYTHAYWLMWKKQATTWRTLFKHANHQCLVAPGSDGNAIGVYNTGSPFVGNYDFKKVNEDGSTSVYTVLDDNNLGQERWRLYIVTGETMNDRPTSYGKASLYVGDENEEIEYKGWAYGNCGSTPTQKNKFWRLGNEAQAPGYVALAAAWSEILTMEDMEELRRHPPNSASFQNAWQ